MGGLGRTINGSYAEYTRAPVTNVAAIESDLSWADLAAIPETYATAWTCLFRNLEIARGPDAGHPRGDLVLRPGGPQHGGQRRARRSSPPPAAVTGSRCSRRSAPSGSEVEGPDLSKRIAEAGKIDAVLDLVGNSTILDSLAMLRRGGRACLAGWLGGLAPIADFNPLLQMASGVYLTFFGSFVFGTPGFPLSDVPLQAIAADVEAAVTRRSRRACSASRTSARRTASWSRTRPTGRWSWSSKWRASRSRGLSRLSVKLWVSTAENVLQIVVKDFGPCL